MQQRLVLEANKRNNGVRVIVFKQLNGISLIDDVVEADNYLICVLALLDRHGDRYLDHARVIDENKVEHEPDCLTLAEVLECCEIVSEE